MLTQLIQGAAGMLLGGVIGSYLATSALRWERHEGASLGRSHCDHCQISLSFVETLPVISWFILKGRCRSCQSSIDHFHLIGEIGGAVTVGLISAFRPWPMAAGESLMGLMLLWLALIDIKTFTLPNLLVLCVALVGAVLSYTNGVLLENSLVALGLGLFVSALAWGLHRLKGQTALGIGDIKLITALTLWLGPASVYVLILASLIGLAHFVVLRRKVSDVLKIPFGPSLAASGMMIGLLIMQVIAGAV